MRLGRVERCSSTVEVRKGAWTAEEDILLKKCVAKYGEGKWHLVPCRAGLNRCRKSCRLRWMNYLKPDIKRGKFSVDEVDLILRLHKLLGNRWSLIAGRIPGRTANDVKNYWNTHRRKIELKCKNDDENNKTIVAKATETNNNDDERHNNIVTSTNIIRPRPRIFKPPHLSLDININNNNNIMMVESPVVQVPNEVSFNVPAPVSDEDSAATNYWLETIKSLSTSCGFDIINSDSDPNIDPISDYYHIENDKISNFGDTTISPVFIEDDNEKCWTDFLADMDLWDVTADGEIK